MKKQNRAIALLLCLCLLLGMLPGSALRIEVGAAISRPQAHDMRPYNTEPEDGSFVPVRLTGASSRPT